MSRESIILTEVWLAGVSFNHKSEVEEYIAECEETIARCRESLKCLAFMTEPKKFCEDNTDPSWWLENETKELLETLEEAIIKRTRAEYIYNGWDATHDVKGGAIFDEVSKDMESYMRYRSDYSTYVAPDGSNPFPDDDIHTRMFNQTYPKE